MDQTSRVHEEVLNGVFGRIAVQPTTYIMPCILWLIVKKPKPTHWTFWFCYLTLPVSFSIMIVGSIGACVPLQLPQAYTKIDSCSACWPDS